MPACLSVRACYVRARIYDLRTIWTCVITPTVSTPYTQSSLHLTFSLALQSDTAVFITWCKRSSLISTCCAYFGPLEKQTFAFSALVMQKVFSSSTICLLLPLDKNSLNPRGTRAKSRDETACKTGEQIRLARTHPRTNRAS